jgi:hypothetical protein
MVSIEARWTTATEEGCSRGVTFKLGRFWPTLVGKASSRTEAEAEAEEDTLINCTGGVAVWQRQTVAEKSPLEREKRVLSYLGL